MNEAYICGRLKKEFEARGFHYMKIADRATKGKPDMAICQYGKTLWLEVKYFPDADANEFETFYKQFNLNVQLMQMNVLSQKAQARYLIATGGEGKVVIAQYRPYEIFEFFHEGVGMPDPIVSAKPLKEAVEVIWKHMA